MNATNASASKTQAPLDFIHTTGPEPHLGRTKQMLKAHPELKELFGNTPSTIFYVIGIVALQVALAAFFGTQDLHWGWMLLTAYVVGACAHHALFVMIHDATHNLIFLGANANRFAGMFANLPLVVPAAIGFRNFHLLHHRYQGEFEFDADLAGPVEAKLVGNSTWRKILWFLGFMIIEGVVRPIRVKQVKVTDSWGLTNLAFQIAFSVAVFALWGPMALAYLFVSTAFSIGLHPLGARWIQEHYVITPGQETYSYYGPANLIAFNVGYHNEHHDLVKVPWSKLPQVKAIAPEFYDSLTAHKSWTGLLLRFLFDRNLSLYSRVVRPDHRRLTREVSDIGGEDPHARLRTMNTETAGTLPAAAIG